MKKTRTQCVRKKIVGLAIEKMTEYIHELTFDEIVLILPKVMDYFTDEQLDILIAEIHRKRLIGD